MRNSLFRVVELGSLDALEHSVQDVNTEDDCMLAEMKYQVIKKSNQ